MKSVVYILVYVIIFPMSDSASQVSFSCDAENQERLRGDPGPPGKRGPKGPVGPVGPTGGDADITSLIDDVRRLNNTVTELRRKLSLYPSEKIMQKCFGRIYWVWHIVGREDRGVRKFLEGDGPVKKLSH